MTGDSGGWRGHGAAAIAVLIWSGWIVVTRDQVSVVAPLDVAIMRYGVPALLLAPIFFRRGLFPRGEKAATLAVMTVGWGAGFGMLTAKGLETVPVALFGPMVPATLPLILAVWDRRANGRIGPARTLGLGLIAFSIALIVVPAFLRADAAFLTGAACLSGSAIGWAAFTLAYRQSRLTGMEATAYVCLYSTPALIAAALVLGTRLASLDPGALAGIALSQGVLSGILAVASFGYAVRRLGAARTAAFTSLVPVGAALGGWLWLGEAVSPMGAASVASACLGVALVTGAFARHSA